MKFANSIKEQLIEKQRLKKESQEDLKKGKWLLVLLIISLILEQDKLLNQSKDYFCTIKDPKALMKSKKQNQRKILDLQVSEKIQRKLEETRNKVNIDSIIIRNAKNEIEEDKQKQDK